MDTRKACSIGVLFLINLLNYMDRYTIAGVLTDVIKFYKLDDNQAGLLQTVFIATFAIFAPICGFLGDRFNRKWIIMAGEVVWVGAVLASSFIPRQHFWAFAVLRGVVGIGEASYVVLAPTLIADMFVGKMRSRILMFFYFAIPVGSGLGYMIGSTVRDIAASGYGADKCDDCWQWGIRATPVISLISLVALAFCVEEPKRGEAETALEKEESVPVVPPNGQSTRAAVEEHQHVDSHPIDVQYGSRLDQIWADLFYLAKNCTFVWSTIGYTWVVFVTGTLSWWAPNAIEQAIDWHHQGQNDTDVASKRVPVSLTFGTITCFGGIVGVAVGSVLSMVWKQSSGHFSTQADPLLSAIGSFAATPLLFLAMKLIELDEFVLAWATLFLTIVCLCLNWAINVDMLMAIIVPHRRAIASAVQVLISHVFGDASGPWIVGVISDWVRGRRGVDSETHEARFHGLMAAFYLPNALLLLSGVAFAVAAFTLPRDMRQVEEWRHGHGAGGHGAVQGVDGSRREEDSLNTMATQQQQHSVNDAGNGDDGGTVPGVAAFEE